MCSTIRIRSTCRWLTSSRNTPNRRVLRWSHTTACRRSPGRCSPARSKKSRKATRRPCSWQVGSSSMISESFTSQIGAAAANTYLTTPTLPARFYPPAARRVLSSYGKAFGAEGNAYALYGYEAMTLVLDAIRDSGARGNDRQTVIDRVLATKNRNSVIGRYSIDSDGET